VGAAGGRSNAESGRTIAGRVFRLNAGKWTDALHRPNLRIVEVEAFSPAYFALLERLPELRPYWTELSNVIVAGREVSVSIASKGAKQLSEAELSRTVREFRFK
jgi:hypothetical protein